MNQNLKTFFVVAGMAVVIVGVGTWMNSQNADQQAAIGRKTKATPVASVDPTSGMSYTQLVQKYATARIQVKESCQVTPVMASFKSGTSVLLDNRSNSAKTVTISGASYSLAPYGYQVVTLSSPTLPATLTVNCGSSVNVGTIRLSQ